MKISDRLELDILKCGLKDFINSPLFALDEFKRLYNEIKRHYNRMVLLHLTESHKTIQTAAAIDTKFYSILTLMLLEMCKKCTANDYQALQLIYSWYLENKDVISILPNFNITPREQCTARKQIRAEDKKTSIDKEENFDKETPPAPREESQDLPMTDMKGDNLSPPHEYSQDLFPRQYPPFHLCHPYYDIEVDSDSGTKADDHTKLKLIREKERALKKWEEIAKKNAELSPDDSPRSPGSRYIVQDGRRQPENLTGKVITAYNSVFASPCTSRDYNPLLYDGRTNLDKFYEISESLFKNRRPYEPLFPGKPELLGKRLKLSQPKEATKGAGPTVNTILDLAVDISEDIAYAKEEFIPLPEMTYRHMSASSMKILTDRPSQQSREATLSWWKEKPGNWQDDCTRNAVDWRAHVSPDLTARGQEHLKKHTFVQKQEGLQERCKSDIHLMKNSKRTDSLFPKHTGKEKKKSVKIAESLIVTKLGTKRPSIQASDLDKDFLSRICHYSDEFKKMAMSAELEYLSFVTPIESLLIMDTKRQVREMTHDTSPDTSATGAPMKSTEHEISKTISNDTELTKDIQSSLHSATESDFEYVEEEEDRNLEKYPASECDLPKQTKYSEEELKGRMDETKERQTSGHEETTASIEPDLFTAEDRFVKDSRLFEANEMSTVSFVAENVESLQTIQPEEPEKQPEVGIMEKLSETKPGVARTGMHDDLLTSDVTLYRTADDDDIKIKAVTISDIHEGMSKGRSSGATDVPSEDWKKMSEHGRAAEGDTFRISGNPLHALTSVTARSIDDDLKIAGSEKFGYSTMKSSLSDRDACASVSFRISRAPIRRSVTAIPSAKDNSLKWYVMPNLPTIGHRSSSPYRRRYGRQSKMTSYPMFIVKSRIKSAKRDSPKLPSTQPLIKSQLPEQRKVFRTTDIQETGSRVLKLVKLNSRARQTRLLWKTKPSIPSNRRSAPGERGVVPHALVSSSFVSELEYFVQNSENMPDPSEKVCHLGVERKPEGVVVIDREESRLLDDLLRINRLSKNPESVTKLH